MDSRVGHNIMVFTRLTNNSVLIQQCLLVPRACIWCVGVFCEYVVLYVMCDAGAGVGYIISFIILQFYIIGAMLIRYVEPVCIRVSESKAL